MELKNYLVTGSGRGIGKSIAEILSSEPCRLILIDKVFPTDFDTFVEKLTERNIPHLVLQIDITKKTDRDWLVDELKKTFGGLHGIVHNAGIHNRNSFLNLTEKQYDTTMDVNLKATIFLTQSLLPLLHKNSSLVFISSVRAFIGGDHALDYTVSKSGMIGAMHELAVELAPVVRANAVVPFSIDTEMIAGDTKKQREERIHQTLLKRLGKPADVAHAVKFLLSDDASFITGQVLHVNGGAYFG